MYMIYVYGMLSFVDTLCAVVPNYINFNYYRTRVLFPLISILIRDINERICDLI